MPIVSLCRGVRVTMGEGVISYKAMEQTRLLDYPVCAQRPDERRRRLPKTLSWLAYLGPACMVRLPTSIHVYNGLDEHDQAMQAPKKRVV
jgi:hypothetical protein